MGALTSRQNAGVEEIDVASNHAYKYPPRSGNYFGSHFIMGGERFDTPQPESYLFGENSDLNFLGSRPTSFPYPPPQANEPTKTLKSLVNIRKESLRFVRAPPDFNKIEGENCDRDLEIGKGSLFNIEFTFDCDVRCAITVYYFCIEEISIQNGVTYTPRDTNMSSDTFHYKRGSNQQFCQMLHSFDPSKFTEEELLYNAEKEVIPIAIHCVAEEGTEEIRQSHTTIAVVEKHSDGTYVLKALKQKLFVDGLCYLLQEIYGIENKNHDKMAGDDENEDNGSECVICMCDVRDTLILPCRHLCLCNSCADSLRYQANNCPICRAPFRALLQIRALQKATSVLQQVTNSPPDSSCDNIPPGYDAVSLIEALNGPCLPRQPPVAAVLDLVETPDTETAVQAAEILNRSENRTPNKGKDGDKRDRVNNACNTPEFRMSVLLSREEECKETQKSPLLADQSPYGRGNKLSRPRDSVKHVNEKNIALEKDETQDEDSEAEKLSPLLHTKEAGGRDGPLALDMAGVVEAIDDTDTEHEEHSSFSHSEIPPAKTKVVVRNCQLETVPPGKGEDPDYYTPKESAPTVTSPLCEPRAGQAPNDNTTDCAPQRPLQSFPGTPISHVSTRSSGESCSSGSSTRHLLAVSQNQSERSVQI